MTDRAVSDVLGYVLVFALVTSTVGVVYGMGIDGLQDAQQVEQMNNVERAFDVLADNVMDIHRHGAPSRATEIKLAGGGLSLGDSTSIYVNGTNQNNPGDFINASGGPEPIVYSDDGASITYVSNAIIRGRDGSHVMIQEPDWVIDDERAVIPMIVTYTTETESLAGSGTYLVTANRDSRVLKGELDRPDDGIDVEIRIESERADAWKDFFEDEGLSAVDSDPSDGAIVYEFETERLYVPVTTAKVSID